MFQLEKKDREKGLDPTIGDGNPSGASSGRYIIMV